MIAPSPWQEAQFDVTEKYPGFWHLRADISSASICPSFPFQPLFPILNHRRKTIRADIEFKPINNSQIHQNKRLSSWKTLATLKYVIGLLCYVALCLASPAPLCVLPRTLLQGHGLSQVRVLGFVCYPSCTSASSPSRRAGTPSHPSGDLRGGRHWGRVSPSARSQTTLQLISPQGWFKYCAHFTD